jgi:Raf kinase inhibitor-like YbhB/YbcL family protein
MRLLRSSSVLTMVAMSVLSTAYAQDTGGQRGGATPPATPSGGRRGGGGGGGRGGGFQNMTLTTTAWPDGGMIPLRYTQAGPEISPTLQWSTPPAGTASFVLVFHDADSLVPNSTDDLMQWMVWNIPPTASGLAQNRPDGFELEDGSRQISASGSRYRGPGASSTGPMHHYILELYALDTMLDIKVAAQGPQDPNPNPQAIRTSIMQAMVGHIRGKAAYTGLFRRPQ